MKYIKTYNWNTLRKETVLVDDKDYSYLKKHKWAILDGYATTYIKIRRGKYKQIFMHRMILNPPDHLVVDHKNENRLDNRRVNIRIATRRQNVIYRKPSKGRRFKGVYKIKGCNKFYSLIARYNKSQLYLGIFEKEEDAARAYDKKCLEIHGEFAYLNLPLNPTPKL